jgi:hypothetical protein
MSELDFKKQLIINEFVTMAKGRGNQEMLPLLLAVSSKARQSGISFTKEDVQLIMDQFKDQLSEKEKQLLPQLLLLMERQ